MNKYSISNTLVYISNTDKLIPSILRACSLPKCLLLICKILVGTLLLSSCASQSINIDQKSAAPVVSSKTSAQEKSHSQKKSIIVSTDSFGVLDFEGKPIKGNGSGDIVLVLNDHGGQSPRKRSFMLDLSYTDKEGNERDLTCNDLISNQQELIIANDQLSRFIEKSSNPSGIQWQVFGILNHYTSSFGIGNLDYINFGLIISEKSAPKKPLNYQGNHRDKSLRANLILENNRYGIEPNGSLVSFSSEDSAFTQALYDKLQNGAQAIASLNKKMHLGIHRVHVNKDESIKGGIVVPSYAKLGKVELAFNKKQQQWQLTISPK